MGTKSTPQNRIIVGEIIVVIGVIAGIFAITVFSYLSSQKKERDSRRKADLKMISQALDQYFDTCGYSFPATIPESGSFACPQPFPKTYLTEMPRDPQSNTPYTYISEKNNSIYSVCTNNMETTTVTKFCISNR